MYRRQIPKPFDPVGLEAALVLVELGARDPPSPAGFGNVVQGLSQLQHREALAGQFLFCFHDLFLLLIGAKITPLNLLRKKPKSTTNIVLPNITVEWCRSLTSDVGNIGLWNYLGLVDG